MEPNINQAEGNAMTTILSQASDDSEGQQLNELVARRRQELGVVNSERTLGVRPLQALCDKMLARHNDPDFIAAERARDAETAELAKAAEQHRRAADWMDLVKARGERYANCTLKNFVADSEKKEDVVLLLLDYQKHIANRIESGESIVLFGPVGTGKDHFAMALAREAIAAGKRVYWQNGMDLFGDIRDAMDKGDAEKTLVNRLVRPDVLYLSDPLPPKGELTPFQSIMLFRIIDARYSRNKPIWATLNVAGGIEMGDRMGVQNADRLKDGALSLYCDWPSYRKVKS